MNITFEDWHRILAAVTEARRAIQYVEDTLIELALKNYMAEEREFLVTQANKVADVPAVLVPYFWTPQSEWLGGDQSGFREPHIVGAFPKPIA